MKLAISGVEFINLSFRTMIEHAKELNINYIELWP